MQRRRFGDGACGARRNIIFVKARNIFAQSHHVPEGTFRMRITAIRVWQVDLPLKEGRYSWSNGNFVESYET